MISHFASRTTCNHVLLFCSDMKFKCILPQDFTDMDRRKEMTYAYTSEEGIYKRVSDEIIKRPPIWHDDEVDSVKVCIENAND